MKRYISIMLIVFLFLTTTLGSMSVFADTEIDETAPQIKSFKFVDSDNINSDSDTINIEFELIEDGTGLCSLYLDFGDTTFYWSDSYDEDEGNYSNPILFTGVHTLSYTFFDKLPVGTHNLTGVRGEDVNGNMFYMDEADMQAQWGGIPSITVTKSSYVHFEPKYKITQFEFLQTDNLDASKSIPVKISFDANFNVSSIGLDFYRTDNEQTEHLYLYPSTSLKTGTYTINIPIEEKMVKGTYRLYAINLNNKYHVDMEECSEICPVTEINITKSVASKKSIDLNSFSIRTNKLNAPAVLKVDLNVETNNNKFNYICLDYDTESGKRIELYGEVEKVKGQTYLAEIPIGPFLGEGKFTLKGVTLSDRKYEDSTILTYYRASEHEELLKDGNIILDSGYNITFFSSLGNSSVVATLKNMKAGETAVLDCRNYKTASKAVFEAIAGRDITVAFIDNNVQWVFNGKDIKKGKCKKINLKSTIKVVSGADAGFPNDTKVAKLIFQNNGELPGEVEMRINYDYLAAKYKFKKENLKLTYLDVNQNATIEDSDVDMAKDQYYEYEVDHNSTFVLSKNKAKIGKTTVTAVPNGLKSVKIKWKKKAGNGYYIYRATKKDGKYKKIATVKKNTTLTYVDKNVKKGKTYYYKVKPYSKKTAFNKTAKMSKPCKAYTRISAPRIYECKKVKNKLRVRLYWTDKVDATKFYVYRSVKKNSGYKKIATVEHCQYVDKKVKKGKTYYYKVKAIYKTNSKCNSKLSAYKSVTVK